MKIKVKREHILAGKKISCRSCPIALAIKEAVKATKKDFVFAGPNRIFVNGQEYKSSIFLGSIMQDFDKHEIMEPFEFEIFEVE